MIKKFFITFILLILMIFVSINQASAATKVMWGKTELKIGQLGKVTILSNTSLWKLNSDGSLIKIRDLKKGEEYRVYSYKSVHGGLYGVGTGAFVQKSSSIKYETPSKVKLRLLNGSKPEIIVTPIDPNPGETNPVEPPEPVEVISVE
ncbi:hypothetical protein [Psychrobacillus sp. FJAT-21963]|uniref:hypothetical protein n=1 Tax=Psychrobacillus sp. FJAT-21963 TaxID=1712028 RepID=UPI000700F0EB|nr:hypothetical protein [Psychrobacillus sp. FJAT-21963]